MNHPDLDELFAKIAVDDRFISREQLLECRNALEAIAKVGVRRSLQDIMIDKGFLTKEEVLEILRRLVREGVRPHIGNFEILNKIGEGGMGAVYRARQVSLDRIVALKVLPPRLAKDEVFVRRFIREAKTAAKLAHKNIITILDVGESNGFHFIAMEYIDGLTVADIVERNGRISEHEAVRICKEVAEGLEFAAQFAIVHRDIKPANIMISRDGTVKLCDMGLAKQTSLQDASVTESGSAIGTPLYMSPEQARGDVEIDSRSDIYSLGATLFFMVTGEPPFRGRTPLEILRKRLELPPPWAGDLNPELDQWICSTIQTMMATDPANRYHSAEELVKLIESHRRGTARAVVARVAQAVRREIIPADVAARRVRRMRTNLIALAATVVLVGVFVAGWMMFMRNGKEKNETAAPAVAPLVSPTASAPSSTEEPSQSASKGPSRKPHPPAPDPHVELKGQVQRLINSAKYAEALSLLQRLPASEAKWVKQTEDAITAAGGESYAAQKKQADALVAEGKLADALALYETTKAYGIPVITALAEEEIKRIRELQNTERLRAEAKERKEYRNVVAKIQEYVDRRDYDAGIAYCENLLMDTRSRSMHRWVGIEKTGLGLLKEVRQRAEGCGGRMAGQEITISGMTGRIIGIEDGNVKLDIRGAPFSKPIEKLKPGEILALALGGEKESPGLYLMRGVFLLYHGENARAKDELLAARAKGEKLAGDFLERIELTASVASDAEIEQLLQQARAAFEKQSWQEVVSIGEKVNLLLADNEAYQLMREEIARLAGRAQVCLLAWGEKDMVLVKASKFRYQKQDDEFLLSFLIDKYEVTNAQYKAFKDYIAATGDHSFCYLNEPKNKDHVPLGFADDNLNRPDQPVVGVDWYDAYAYAACVFKRLPTEKEWEKAARGETGWLYPWGNQPDEARVVSGSELDGAPYPVPVTDTRFASGASPFGCVHMLGNAAEWTADWFDDLKTGRVIRGGSWNTRLANTSLTALSREGLEPTVKKPSVGFRCARTVK